MNTSEALHVVKSFHWEKWLNRPWDSSFLCSLFCGGNLPEAIERTGIPIVMKSILYQNGYWYRSPKVFQEAAGQAGCYLEKHRMIEVVKACDNFYVSAKKTVPQGTLQEAFDILTTATAFIWLTHGLEEYLGPLLQKEASRIFGGKAEEFIRQASFPLKKTAYALMEEAMLRKISPEQIAREFGWLKIRDGFSEPFSPQEILEQMKYVKISQRAPLVPVPPELQQLVEEMKELVYFRTHRTDVFYELLYLARPALKRAAQERGLSFSQLRDHPIHYFLTGRLEKVTFPFTMICYDGKTIFQKEPLLEEEERYDVSLLKGVVAQPGKIMGTAKVLLSPEEMGKVQKGDILITQMTFPAYLPAMQKAAAFVTDEGGLTCHAAIVAREMGKPCVIATKIATKVFKDGDLVEVDAEKGMVRKISA